LCIRRETHAGTALHSFYVNIFVKWPTMHQKIKNEMRNVARPVGEAGGGLRRTTLAIGDNAGGGHKGKRWYSRCGETAHPVQQNNHAQ
jgi:hypothetical protein